MVFDGASQNAVLTIPVNTTNEGMRIESYDNGINRIILEKNGTQTTARIQDISSVLLTGNETLAIDILKNYMKPGCNEMYFIASSDLISKSQWWTYFATWTPTDKGQKYYYVTVSLSQAKPNPSQNSLTYSYSMSSNQAFLVYQVNNTLKPYLQQGNQFLTVEKISYFTNEGIGITTVFPGADVKGTLWVTPDKEMIIYIPPELETSLFTRMYLYNGQGVEGGSLKNFELAGNWGGEVKLYRIVF